MKSNIASQCFHTYRCSTLESVLFLGSFIEQLQEVMGVQEERRWREEGDGE